MEKNAGKQSKAVWVLKALLISYVVTGIFLLVLALLLYQFNLDEQKVTMGIVLTYVVSTFAGGWVLGKLVGERRFFWGIILGSAYFLLLFGVSVAVNHDFGSNGMNLITTMFLCAGGGMIGGMVS